MPAPIAGSGQGFADGTAAKFDTPKGIAMSADGASVLVADENIFVSARSCSPTTA